MLPRPAAPGGMQSLTGSSSTIDTMPVSGHAIAEPTTRDGYGMEVRDDVRDAASSTEAQPKADWIRRYLALLQVESEPPSLEALARLTRAHLEAVPFENISSLVRARGSMGGPIPPLDVDAKLTSWEEGRSGGICFEVTEVFPRLLVALGYRLHPVQAQISFPGSHQAILVELDGERYLVDAANGAPFFDPIPLTGEFEVHCAGLAYRFRPGGSAGEWLQDRGIGKAWRRFCTYDLNPPTQADRDATYQRHHVHGESFVASDVVMIRCQDDTVWVFREGALTRYTAAGKRSERFSEPVEIERLAREIFRLPALPVQEGIAALHEISQRAKASPAGRPATY